MPSIKENRFLFGIRHEAKEMSDIYIYYIYTIYIYTNVWHLLFMVKAKRITVSHTTCISPLSQQERTACCLESARHLFTLSKNKKKSSKEEIMNCRHSFSEVSHPHDCSGAMLKIRKKKTLTLKSLNSTLKVKINTNKIKVVLNDEKCSYTFNALFSTFNYRMIKCN